MGLFREAAKSGNQAAPNGLFCHGGCQGEKKVKRSPRCQHMSEHPSVPWQERGDANTKTNGTELAREPNQNGKGRIPILGAGGLQGGPSGCEWPNH